MRNAATFALPSPKRRALLERTTARYERAVDQAEVYLKGRGIPIELARSWRLGVVVDPEPEHESRVGRLAIPYLTPTGVTAMNFRCIEDHCCKTEGSHHKKYLMEPGSGTYLYGVRSFKADSPFICIAEGELDALCAAGLASMPCVGIPGTTKWLPHWRFCFEGYDQVIVLKDGDDEGDKLAVNVTRHLYNARVVPMPEGHDVNSFILEYGPQALRDRAGVDEPRSD